MPPQGFKMDPRLLKVATSMSAGFIDSHSGSGSPGLDAPGLLPTQAIGSPMNLDPKTFQFLPNLPLPLKFLPPAVALDPSALMAMDIQGNRRSKKRGKSSGQSLPNAKRPKVVIGPASPAALAAKASSKKKKKKKKRKSGKSVEVISYPENTVFDVNTLPPLQLKCPYCPFTAPKTKALYKHINEHDKKMVCPTCSKKSTCMGMFVYHCRTHTGEKPYKCPIPGCKFSSAIKCNLKIHLESALHGDDGARTLRIFGPVLDMDSHLKNNTPGAFRAKRNRKKKKKQQDPFTWNVGMGMDPMLLKMLQQGMQFPGPPPTFPTGPSAVIKKPKKASKSRKQS